MEDIDSSHDVEYNGYVEEEEEVIFWSIPKSTKILKMFVKLYNRNNYDELIFLVADMDETDFKLGELNVKQSHFSISRLKMFLLEK